MMQNDKTQSHRPEEDYFAGQECVMLLTLQPCGTDYNAINYNFINYLSLTVVRVNVVEGLKGELVPHSTP